MGWTSPKTWSVGETLTAANFNTQIRDNLNAVGPHLVVRKTADESVTSSITMQNDDSLVFAIAANEAWHSTWVLLTNAATTGDIQIGWTMPSSCTISYHCAGVSTAAASSVQVGSNSTSPTTALQFGGLGAQNAIIACELIVVSGGTAGSVQLQWAQVSSDVTATIVRANSTLWAVKLA